MLASNGALLPTELRASIIADGEVKRYAGNSLSGDFRLLFEISDGNRDGLTLCDHSQSVITVNNRTFNAARLYIKGTATLEAAISFVGPLSTRYSGIHSQ